MSKPKKFRVTAKLLKRLGACGNGLDRFKRKYPKGVLYGLRALNRCSRDGFGTSWLLWKILSVREYKRTQAAGNKVCKERDDCPNTGKGMVRCCARRWHAIHKAAMKAPIIRSVQRLIKECS